MTSLRNAFETAWHEALRDLDPTRLVRQHLEQLELHGPATLIAVGKAAPAMALGAFQALTRSTHGLVITTDGTRFDGLPTDARVMFASHPVPDARSIAAAEAALRLARTTHDRTLLVLVSGGASSLLCAPTGLSFAQKHRVTDQLLRSGASIRAFNTVRRHISGVKGGGLAVACPARVHCAVISDVVGGAVHDVGSGPAVPDPTTVQDARDIVRRYLEEDLAVLCEAAFRESLKPTQDVLGRVSSAMLASPEDLARALSSRLREQGWDVGEGRMLEATAEKLSEALLRHARELAPGQGWVVACEPTLHVPDGACRGGRAGWVALHALRSLPDDVTLWAAASDGVDGSGGTGGACVTGKEKHSIDPTSIEACLLRRNDVVAHAALGSSLQGKPTGLNLTDVYAVLRAR
jgi:hydroxypyruvate reductase